MHSVFLRLLKSSFKFLWHYKLVPIPWATKAGPWMLLYNDQQGLELLKDYEPHVVTFLKSYLKPGMLFIDAGANQGFYTLLAKSLGARVIAFEPVPDNIKRLRRNLILNGFRETGLLVILQSALGNSYKASSNFLVPQYYESRSSFAPLPFEVLGKVKTLNVETLALDDCLFDSPDVIKIDVEGAELQVLKGMERILTVDKPVLILEVADVATRQFNYKAQVLLNFLDHFGYKPLKEIEKSDYYRLTEVFLPNTF